MIGFRVEASGFQGNLQVGRFHVGTLTGGLCRAHIAQYPYTSLCGCYMLVYTPGGVLDTRGRGIVVYRVM